LGTRQIYVVLHPEATHHVDQLVGGWYDSDLTDRGVAQAGRIADRLRSLIPAGESVDLTTSDLRRTVQTADVIGERLGVVPVATPDLREKSYGVAEGRPQPWLDERFRFPPPVDGRMDHWEGIDGSETRRDIATRVYRAMDGILARPAPHQVIVTHGFAHTFVVAHWLGMPLEAADRIGLRTTSGAITHLREDDVFHNRGIVMLNDASHL
jgi:probable phosphoglycerate mutase